MQYRLAKLDDIELLAELRKRQLVDEGSTPDKDIDAELTAFFTEKLTDGSMVEWVIEEGQELIATAAIIFYAFPPNYTNKSGLKGYVTNMYTAPAWRGRGLASSLLDRLTEEARRRGVSKLWLGASTMGRPVYLKYGFKESDQWLELDL